MKKIQTSMMMMFLFLTLCGNSDYDASPAQEQELLKTQQWLKTLGMEYTIAELTKLKQPIPTFSLANTKMQNITMVFTDPNLVVKK